MSAPTRWPYRLTAFVGDRVTVYGPITMPTGEDLTGATLQFRGYTAGGAEQWDYSTAPGVEVTDGAASEYQAVVYTDGFAAGDYYWQVRRTDSGGEGVLVYGTLHLMGYDQR